jgi:hypothetical protein
MFYTTSGYILKNKGAVKKHSPKTDRHITESIDGYVPVVV